jgi:hypothetical protein
MERKPQRPQRKRVGKPAVKPETEELIRLNKYIANSGCVPVVG